MAYSEITLDIPQEVRRLYCEEEKPLFIAYGCVLLERYTGKSYIYNIINIKNKNRDYIYRRKNRILETDYPNIAERIWKSPIAEKGQIEISEAHGERSGMQKLMDVQGHIFRDILPANGFGIRERQIELAHQMLSILGRKQLTLAEAGVGIGKTHAYLIASILIKRGRINDLWLMGNYPGISYKAGCEMPVVISTSSIMLQRAIIREYIPALSKILMGSGVITAPLTGILRKGKGRYVCEKRLIQCFNDEADRGVREALKAVLEKKSLVDLDEISGLNPYLKRRVCVKEGCSTRCSNRIGCRYIRYLNHALTGVFDFQVCNHNYLLADTIRRSKGQRPLIPHYQAIIIDEAHKFLQAARQLYGVTVSSITLPLLAKEILTSSLNNWQATQALEKDARKMTTQGAEMFNRLIQNMHDVECDEDAERFATVIDEQAVRYMRNIREIIVCLLGRLGKEHISGKGVGARERVISRLNDLSECLGRFIQHEQLVYWLEKAGRKDDVLLCAIPKALHQILCSDLWYKGIPIILTSGTLSAAGNFGHIKKITGLDQVKRLSEISVPSPFDYKKNTLLYISEQVPFPDNTSEQYIRTVAEEIMKLIIATHGHTVVLFTSYRTLGLVFERIKEQNLPFPLFKIDKQGGRALQQYRTSGNGVLFATGSMWEGVNLPGDILSSLIIVKLPFAVPDPVSDFENTLFGSFREYKEKVIVPDMLIKLKQGFGRLIRSETDTGVVVLLDSRARKMGQYHEQVISALPEMPITENIEDVEAFIRKVKPDSYFSE